jgi:1,4-alpha-glucan branching enzyme
MTTKRRPIEFEALNAIAHKAGLKVIIDIVPNYIVRENIEKKFGRSGGLWGR